MILLFGKSDIFTCIVSCCPVQAHIDQSWALLTDIGSYRTPLTDIEQHPSYGPYSERWARSPLGVRHGAGTV